MATEKNGYNPKIPGWIMYSGHKFTVRPETDNHGRPFIGLKNYMILNADQNNQTIGSKSILIDYGDGR